MTSIAFNVIDYRVILYFEMWNSLNTKLTLYIKMELCEKLTHVVFLYTSTLIAIVNMYIVFYTEKN